MRGPEPLPAHEIIYAPPDTISEIRRRASSLAQLALATGSLRAPRNQAKATDRQSILTQDQCQCHRLCDCRLIPPVGCCFCRVFLIRTADCESRWFLCFLCARVNQSINSKRAPPLKWGICYCPPKPCTCTPTQHPQLPENRNVHNSGQRLVGPVDVDATKS